MSKRNTFLKSIAIVASAGFLMTACNRQDQGAKSGEQQDQGTGYESRGGDTANLPGASGTGTGGTGTPDGASPDQSTLGSDTAGTMGGTGAYDTSRSGMGGTMDTLKSDTARANKSKRRSGSDTMGTSPGTSGPGSPSGTGGSTGDDMGTGTGGSGTGGSGTGTGGGSGGM